MKNNQSRPPRYRVGHPAYAGSNEAFYANTLRECFVELEARKVNLREVHKELRGRFDRRPLSAFHFILRNANGAQVEFKRFPYEME